MTLRAPPSLKARAIALLAQREHSVAELRRKLSARADEGDDVEALLTWLQDQGHLSDARFAASRVHLRAGGHGAARIRQELAQHGVQLDAEVTAQLRASEAERARAVWQKKFGAVAPDLAGRARQMRFLLTRGFAPDVVRRLCGGLDER